MDRCVWHGSIFGKGFILDYLGKRVTIRVISREVYTYHRAGNAVQIQIQTPPTGSLGDLFLVFNYVILVCNKIYIRRIQCNPKKIQHKVT